MGAHYRRRPRRGATSLRNDVPSSGRLLRMDHGHLLVRSSVLRQQCSPGPLTVKGRFSLGEFLAELRRRRVIRVLVLYAIAGWLIVQIAATVLPGLNVPPWSVTLVIVLVALGLPLAAILAWAFDVGDGGITRSPAANERSETARASQIAGGTRPGRTGVEPLEKSQDRDLPPRMHAAPHDERRSIAVLPFVNMSGDPENEYFSDGISEEILNLLTKLPKLRVSSRTSSFAFKGKDIEMSTVAERLGVGTVLEGSVRRAGDRVRITAQLIDTKSDSHLWSESYDRRLEDVFAIQDDIARCIVSALRMTLTPQERLAIQYTATSNPQAYDFYLRGRSYYNAMTKRGFTHALTLYQEAIERDPNYALAFAGIADVYSFLYKYGGATSEIAGRALDASQRAVELDGGLAEAHTSRGLALSINGRHEEAEREFEQAIRLKPSLYEAYYFYGRDCVSQGRNDKAARLFAQAVAINPDYYEAFPFLATAYRKTDRREEAMDANRRGVAAAEKHLEMYPDDARALYLGAGALIATGDAVRATEWAERALEAAPHEPSVLYNVGCMYSMMGNKERAIELVDEAVRKGFGYRAWLEQDGDLDPIRDDPRFKAILARLG
jgi:adenylate cyclase